MDGYRVIRGPVELEGGAVGRVVETSDGGMRVETWSLAKASWVVGGARFSDFFFTSSVSPARAKELRIPNEIPGPVMASDETEGAIVQARIEEGSSSPDWRVVKGPVSVEGGAIARLLRSDGGRGSALVETWSPGKGWVEGGASVDEVLFDGIPVSASRAKEFGIPNEMARPAPESAETEGPVIQEPVEPAPTSSDWRVSRGPMELEGGTVGRLVRFPDGSGRLETWSRSKGAWVPGGARLSDMFFASPLSPERANELHIPLEETAPREGVEESSPNPVIPEGRGADETAGAQSPNPGERPGNWRVVRGHDQALGRPAQAPNSPPRAGDAGARAEAADNGMGRNALRREYRKGLESAKIRSWGQGIRKGLVMGAWLAVVLSFSVVWYWKIAIWLAGTFVMGLIVQAYLMARERRESASRASADSAQARRPALTLRLIARSIRRAFVLMVAVAIGWAVIWGLSELVAAAVAKPWIQGPLFCAGAIWWAWTGWRYVSLRSR
jgi:hypothetical protein